MQINIEPQEPHRQHLANMFNQFSMNELINCYHLILVTEQSVELPGYPRLSGGGRVVGVADAWEGFH